MGKPTRSGTLSRQLRTLSAREGWQPFCRRYGLLVWRFASKAGLDETRAAQVTFDTLSQFALSDLTTAEMQHAEPLCHRLFGEARTRVLQQAATQSSKPSELSHGILRLLWDAEWQNLLWNEALESIKTKVSPTHFQIFCLSVIEGFRARKVAAMIGVNSLHVLFARCWVGSFLRRELALLHRQLNTISRFPAPPPRTAFQL